MKIYNKVKIDMSTNETLEEDSFEYEGEVAQAGAAAVPIAVAVFSSVASVAAQRMFGPDAPDMPAMPGMPGDLAKPEDQPIEPTDALKETEMLAAQAKRKKQGFLQSFGLPEDIDSFGLM